LIDAAETRATDFKLALILRRNLQSLPDRIAALVAAETDIAGCHRLIFGEVNATLEEIIEAMGAEAVDDGELDISRRDAVAALDENGPDINGEDNATSNN
jgi:hypothetical protein